MQQQTDVTQLVAAYTAKRLRRLALLCGSCFTITLLVPLIMQSALSHHHNRLTKEYENLTATHLTLGKQWKASTNLAKQRKALLRDPKLSNHSELISSIAGILPPHSLLTQLTIHKETLSLEGYASSAEELSSLLVGLSSLKLTTIRLSNSSPGPAGIAFIINSCV